MQGGLAFSKMRPGARTLLGACIVVAAAIVACTSGFTVKRVTSDDRTTEGLRFYRPWPNLVVTKEFPIANSACFVTGTLSANGQYIEMDGETVRFLNGGVLPLGATGNGSAAQLPVGALGQNATLQAGTTTLRPSSNSSAGDGGTGASDSGQSSSTSGGDGGTSVSITSGTGTQPIQLSDSLSLVYLPDESQDYVIQFSGSTQDAKLTLTSGWMLEGLNVQSQNVVANIVQNVLTSVLPALEKLIPGLQAGTAMISGAAGAGAPQAVVIKVHMVQYAVPGVYPRSHGTYSPAETSKTPVACDPKVALPAVVEFGMFKMQTRTEVLLEVQSVGGTQTSGGSAGDGTTPSAEKCASAVDAAFGTWAPGHSGGVLLTPKVLAASGGKVVIGIKFGANVTATQKTAALTALKTVPLSVVQNSACSPNVNSVIVCDQDQPNCKAAP